jgi:hypothetical protein
VELDYPGSSPVEVSKTELLMVIEEKYLEGTEI